MVVNTENYAEVINTIFGQHSDFLNVKIKSEYTITTFLSKLKAFTEFRIQSVTGNRR
jgi:hypothetical protein